MDLVCERHTLHSDRAGALLIVNGRVILESFTHGNTQWTLELKQGRLYVLV